MDILYHHEVLFHFIVNHNNANVADNYILLWNALKNNQNKIVYSDSYMNLIEKEWKDKDRHEYYDELERFILEKLDNDSIRHQDCCNQNNVESEFIQLFINHTEFHILFAIVMDDSQALNLMGSRKIVYNNITKHDANWIKMSLVTRNPCVLRHNCFANDFKISELLNELLSIPKTLHTVYIFSDFYNFSSNDCLSALNSFSVNIHYISRGYKMQTIPGLNRRRRVSLTQNELNNNKSALIQKFGNKLRYFITNDSTITHERRIVFENFFLIFDHDFEQIKVSNRNWQITIEYLSSEYSSLMGSISNCCTEK